MPADASTDRLVLLTRPLEQSQAVARALDAHGIACLIWPLTRIVRVAESVEIQDRTQGLLFTSINGVRAVAALSARRDLPAFCVGPTTAEAARDAGFAEVHSAEGDAGALAQIARESGLIHFLHPHGADVAGDLRSAGIVVDEAVVYRAQETGPPTPAVADALAGSRVAVATAWSPRGARLLARHLAGFDMGRTALVTISLAAAVPLADSGFAATRIAESPSRAGMLAAILAVFPSKSG